MENYSFSKRICYYSDIAMCALFTVFLVAFAMAVPYQTRYNAIVSDLSKRVNYYDNPTISNNLAILKNAIEINKNVDLLINKGDYYYTKLGLKNNTDITSSVDWYTKKDIEKINEYLNTTQDKVVIDDMVNGWLVGNEKAIYEQLINKRFIKSDLGGGYHLYTLKEPSK